MKYSFTKKLNVISEILCGKGVGIVCQEQRLDKHMVQDWLARYKLYGKDGLRKSTKGYYFTPKKKRK